MSLLFFCLKIVIMLLSLVNMLLCLKNKKGVPLHPHP